MWKKISVALENGKTLRIEAPEASEQNIYVQSCKIDGKSWNRAWIDHNTIKNGATIKFEMGPLHPHGARVIQASSTELIFSSRQNSSPIYSRHSYSPAQIEAGAILRFP